VRFERRREEFGHLVGYRSEGKKRTTTGPPRFGTIRLPRIESAPKAAAGTAIPIPFLLGPNQDSPAGKSGLGKLVRFIFDRGSGQDAVQSSPLSLGEQVVARWTRIWHGRRPFFARPLDAARFAWVSSRVVRTVRGLIVATRWNLGRD